jgi:integrase
VIQRKPTTLTTIGGFVTEVYLAFIKANKRPSTVKGYRDMWKQHWQPRCEDRLMRDVRTVDVQGWLDSIAKAAPLSRESLKHLKSVLSGIFAHAKRQGCFDGVNPVRDTAIPPAPEGGETYAYSLEEVTAMLLRLPEPARTIVAVAAYTGARRGEIRGMRWQDLHDGAIYVDGSVWESYRGKPKTRASAAPIPVIPSLAVILERHRARIGSPSSGPMFPAANGQSLSLGNVVNRQIRPSLSPGQWHGWHAFRRGLATNLYRLGVSDKVIQAIMRLADLSTTQNVYIKTVSEDAVNAMSVLDSTLVCTSCAPDEPKAIKPVVN